MFHFVWHLISDQSGKGDPEIANAIAGIALQIKGAHKPLHLGKVETSL